MLEVLGMNAAGAAIDNTIGLLAGGVQANRQMRNQMRELKNAKKMQKALTKF